MTKVLTCVLVLGLLSPAQANWAKKARERLEGMQVIVVDVVEPNVLKVKHRGAIKLLRIAGIRPLVPKSGAAAAALRERASEAIRRLVRDGFLVFAEMGGHELKGGEMEATHKTVGDAARPSAVPSRPRDRTTARLYGRVALVESSSDQDLGTAIVSLGYAEPEAARPRTDYQKKLLRALAEARKAKRGYWASVRE